jgi:hypothetical protein
MSHAWNCAPHAQIASGRVVPPPMPTWFAEIGVGGAVLPGDAELLSDLGRHPPRPHDPERIWRTVIFAGAYGPASERQRVECHDIPESEIPRIGWALFGMRPGWTAQRS